MSKICGMHIFAKLQYMLFLHDHYQQISVVQRCYFHF